MRKGVAKGTRVFVQRHILICWLLGNATLVVSTSWTRVKWKVKRQEVQGRSWGWVSTLDNGAMSRRQRRHLTTWQENTATKFSGTITSNSRLQNMRCSSYSSDQYAWNLRFSNIFQQINLTAHLPTHILSFLNYSTTLKTKSLSFSFSFTSLFNLSQINLFILLII